ncbi:MAG: YhfC family intramembrane metalloprotease [Clostridia bacterium]|nr:YhfC family intramembrane metalloprotease [Clostridia bacterium]
METIKRSLFSSRPPAARSAVKAAAAFDYAMMAMNVFERLLAMFLHIGLTVLVFYGVCNAKKACLPAAILLHMLANTFPALYQRGVVPLWAVEVWGAFWTAVIVCIAVVLYRKMQAPPCPCASDEPPSGLPE